MLQLLNLHLNVHLVLILERLAMETLVLVDSLEMVSHVSDCLYVLPELLYVGGVGEYFHVFVVEERQGELRRANFESNSMCQFLQLIGIVAYVVMSLSALDCALLHQVPKIISKT